MYVAPNKVSGRVVNTSISPASVANCTAAPVDRPIQLRCMVLTLSGQSSTSEVVEQPIGVRGDTHHPLPQPFPEHREIAPIAAAVGGDLLVGQHGAQTRAPVHHRVGPVHQPIRVDDVGAFTRRQIRPSPAVVECPATGLEFGDQFGDRSRFVGRRIEPCVVDLQEDPLRPLVEVDVGGGEAAAGVVAQPQSAQLATEIDDVRFGAGARMRTGLHGVLLGGQSERVEPQRVQDITAGHPVVARVDVGGDVAERVSDVQTLSGRVREHVLHEHLVGGHRGAVGRRQRAHGVGHVERPRIRPPLLPGMLDLPSELRGIAVLRDVGAGVGRVSHLNRV